MQICTILMRHLSPQVGPGGLDQGDQGSRQGGDRASRNVVLPRQRKKSVKERNEAADALAHTALMKKKLQEARQSTMPDIENNCLN